MFQFLIIVEFSINKNVSEVIVIGFKIDVCLKGNQICRLSAILEA